MPSLVCKKRLLFSVLIRDLIPKQVRELVIKGKRLSKPDSMPAEIFDITSACWEQEPSARPSFSQIRRDIQAHIHSMISNNGSGNNSSSSNNINNNTGTNDGDINTNGSSITIRTSMQSIALDFEGGSGAVVTQRPSDADSGCVALYTGDMASTAEHAAQPHGQPPLPAARVLTMPHVQPRSLPEQQPDSPTTGPDHDPVENVGFVNRFLLRRGSKTKSSSKKKSHAYVEVLKNSPRPSMTEATLDPIQDIESQPERGPEELAPTRVNAYMLY